MKGKPIKNEFASRHLPVMASLALLILSAALAQQEVIASDRSSDGQVGLAGDGSPLDPDSAAVAGAGLVPLKPKSPHIGIERFPVTTSTQLEETWVYHCRDPSQ